MKQITFPTSDDWRGCYRDSWKDQISNEAFAHPAKFSRSLIRRIYDWLTEQGHLTAGDTVIDPFGGVGLGAADAVSRGINWLGCELEARFVDLGQGCECTGISKADWVRFYGRWDKANHRDGRHWCPRCIGGAKQIIPGQSSFFESASYVQNSGRIPHTSAHTYDGNIPAYFSRFRRKKATATLLQGDSRRLGAVLAESGAVAVVSSPPYVDSINHNGIENDTEARKRRMKKAGIDITSAKNTGGPNANYSVKQSYGEAAGQLGAMPAGQLAAILTSPPYADQELAQASDGNIELHQERRTSSRRYADSSANLGSLKPGEFDAAITSPPFAGNSGGRGDASRNGIDAGLFDRHQGGMVGGIGAADSGNLAALQARDNDLDAVITSPPYEDSINNDHSGGIDWEKAGRSDRLKPSKNRNGVQGEMGMVYGTTPGQLGADSGDTFWSAARLILEQCYQQLAVDGVAVFVTKDFVKNGQRVEFSQQWARLCVAVGLEPLAHFRAWLVEEAPGQLTIDGDVVRKRTERKSFFRRLAEKNGSPRIDHEDVLIFRKPPAARDGLGAEARR